MSRGRYILPLIALIFGSCIAAGQLSEVKDVDPAGWFQPAEVTFTVEQTADLTKLSQINIIMRCDNTFSADSVELILTTIAPDGVYWSEQHVINTEENRGETRIIESVYRDRVHLSQKGVYKIIAQPLHIYHGITAVGVNIIEK